MWALVETKEIAENQRKPYHPTAWQTKECDAFIVTL